MADSEYTGAEHVPDAPRLHGVDHVVGARVLAIGHGLHLPGSGLQWASLYRSEGVHINRACALGLDGYFGVSQRSPAADRHTQFLSISAVTARLTPHVPGCLHVGGRV